MKTESLYTGRWMSLLRRRFRAASGHDVSWEFVQRTGTTHGVTIVAIIPGPPEQIVLIRQYRAPVDAYVMELPAGLVDAGEDPAAAGLRELAEETGYAGEVVEVGPLVCSSPGLTDEAVHYLEVRVTHKGPTAHGHAEDIEVVTVPVADLRTFLLAESARGTRISAKLWFWASATARGR